MPSSGWTVWNMFGNPSVFPAKIAGPCSRSVSFMFTMRRIGSSGLPVAFAGQLSVHRPHSVHAKPSRSCLRLNCSTRCAPKRTS